MAQINVANLTYEYENSFDRIFEDVSFSIDTNWKLGLLGRNGKGKTTLLHLLLGKYAYTGTITTSTRFDYFPYEVSKEQMEQCASMCLQEWKADCEEWRVICELGKLKEKADLLYEPLKNLSHGERTKVLLAVLFSGENEFLLIDEPTNHLDCEGRKCVKEYLQKKKGYILVSHDRDLLDACVDHVLVLNRKSIEVQSGNFSSWWENKNRKDKFVMAENDKHLREIKNLKNAANRSRRWAEKNEGTKIGFDPVKEPERNISTRSYIGAKTKKMQSRVTQYERRIENEIEEKQGLLQDIENPVSLKLYPRKHPKERLLFCKNICAGYSGSQKNVLQNFDFELKQGERVFLQGENGCGKSTFLQMILAQVSNSATKQVVIKEGTIQCASGLVVSYVNQDTGFLCGSIYEFCQSRGLEEQLFLALLRQLDMERMQFTKDLEMFSEGQKKKVLLAASLMTPAHLYIWDEPLNYIDVFSRIQLENLILQYKPTIIIVEHDSCFQKKIATRVVQLKKA